MFNALATIFRNASPAQDEAQALRVHPVQLSRWLEQVWNAGPRQITDEALTDVPFLGEPPGIVANTTRPTLLLESSGIDLNNPLNFVGGSNPVSPAGGPAIWHHLIYAYLLENTGMVEIFAEVLRRCAH